MHYLLPKNINKIEYKAFSLSTNLRSFLLSFDITSKVSLDQKKLNLKFGLELNKTVGEKGEGNLQINCIHF